jgi:hypothetical protein
MTAVNDRVRAARIQAGCKRREDLIALMRLPRCGDRLLGMVERGQRPAGMPEINARLDAIMRHLGIDAEGFGIDADVALQENGDPVFRRR